MAHTPLPNAISLVLVEIFGSLAHPLAVEMAEWMRASKRFRVFAETYRDKIRKKARHIRDEEGLRDLGGELAVAHALLQEPRFAVAYELYGASKHRAPDFTVTFKDNLPFQLEVTRLQARLRDPSAPAYVEDARLTKTVCGKLGQMQPGMINVIAVLTEGQPYEEADVAATTKALILRAASKDEAYFVSRGFSDSRDFLHQYQRLSGILLISGWQHESSSHTAIWENNQARQPIPGPLLNSLRRFMRVTDYQN